MAKTSKEQPIYMAIYEDLRQQIFSGKLVPGDLLPSESQLCEAYQASRVTVRKGLQALENEQLIFSRPKIGYFVSKPNHSDLTLTFSWDIDECRSQYKSVHGIMADAALAKLLDIPVDTVVIQFDQIVFSPDDHPMAYDIKYVPYEKAYPTVESDIRYAVFPDFALSKMTAFSFYTSIRVSVAVADQTVAEALGCSVGAPMMLVERVFTQQNGRPVGYSKQYLRQAYGYLEGTSGHMR